MKEEDMMRMKGRWARLGTGVRRRWKPAGGRRGGRKGDDEGEGVYVCVAALGREGEREDETLEFC